MSTVLQLINKAEPVPSILPLASERPCRRIYDEPFEEEGRQYKAGVYWHGMSYEKGKGGGKPTLFDTRICGPLRVIAQTSSPTVESGSDFGRLLEFKNLSGKMVRHSIPNRRLVGDSSGVLQDLADLGLSIEARRKEDILDYILSEEPSRQLRCATSGGWCGTGAFVLPDQVYGPGKDDVVYQAGHNLIRDLYSQAGTLDGWQHQIAAPAVGNPILMLGISTAFAGPLLQLVGMEGGGVHFVGASSIGKSTILVTASSVWGPKSFRRTWRTTSNGLEGIAEMHNDNLLPLDEVSECDPTEVGRIIYMLAHGRGKGRADRSGGARPAKSWDVMILSTGERSIEASIAEGRSTVKAGQLVRIMDVRVERQHGCFDTLHGFMDGRAFADGLKAAANVHYGHAGRAFLEALTTKKRDLQLMLANLKSDPRFKADSSQAGRAAERFALIGMAGELATEDGITGWPKGSATGAAVEGFRLWQDWFGKGNDEPRRIKQAVLEFIDTHGASRFMDLSAPLFGQDAPKVYNRAGWLKVGSMGQTIYCFHPTGLRAATKNFDFRTVTRLLVDCGVLAKSDKQNSTNLRVGGNNERVYEIDGDKLRSCTPAVDGQAPAKKPPLEGGKASKTKKAPMDAKTAALAKEL